jgi:hypothetical protein
MVATREKERTPQFCTQIRASFTRALRTFIPPSFQTPIDVVCTKHGVAWRECASRPRGSLEARELDLITIIKSRSFLLPLI